MATMRRFRLALLVVTLSGWTLLGRVTAAPVAPKPRVVVTADPELDDSNSLVRYLLYSTDFQTEGIIYASSGFHWKGDGTGKKWSMPNREYVRFGLNLCPCESWRWDPKERFIAILSPSGDQDDTGKSYIQPNWPDIKTLPIGGGGVPLAYGAAARAGTENAVYYSAEWTRENISSRGAFGAFYRVWGDGKQMVKDDIFDYFGFSGLTADQLKAKGYIVWTPPLPAGAFIGEGDTFTYLNLLDNGLLGYKNDTIGGWAGDGVSTRARPGIGQGNAPAARPSAPDPNFTPAAQNGFAIRMKWSVTPAYADANHEPRVTIRGSVRISARPGETLRLQGVTSDPDKNAVAVKWWQWKDVDIYPGQVTFSNPNSLATSIQVPTDDLLVLQIPIARIDTNDFSSSLNPLTLLRKVLFGLMAKHFH